MDCIRRCCVAIISHFLDALRWVAKLWVECFCRCTTCVTILALIVLLIVLNWQSLVFAVTEYQYIPPTACLAGMRVEQGRGCVPIQPSLRVGEGAT